MDCLKRTVVDIKESNTYKDALNEDPTLGKGVTSYWCIPSEWVKPAMKLSGEWDESNDTKSEFEAIEIEVDESAANDPKAYVKGIDCDPEQGWCPYEDMTCVGRFIVKVNPESKQY